MSVIKLTPNTMEVIPLPDSLAKWHKELNCSCFTVTYRPINNKLYAIFADDEGLLKQGYVPTLILDYDNNKRYNGVLVGNLIITNESTDEEGFTLPLTEEDIVSIKANLKTVQHRYKKEYAWRCNE